MVRLIAKTPAAGLLPIEGPGVLVEEVAREPLTSLAPLAPGLNAALKDAHGLALPKPGRMTRKAGARCAWFSRGHYLLIGPEPAVELARLAALTDQSDAWCRVALTGPRATELLTYLTPLDLRDTAFKRGHAARSLIGHMNALILRTGARSYELFVFQSMAATLVHEVKEALQALPPT
ncbi:MAG: sarcosine oxidase subunit gamma family protein [Pseudomonadota bacterium]